ncbi:MAG: response regulator [Candidatus Eisenbacteria sp.]|nr:response regulator [Candidatus Eisenbacteria bacterium]
MSSVRQTILWVDDEIDLLKSHILYLESKGYRVTPISNGIDALDLVEKERFDLVLLDEMMPGMGGLEVLEGIKARRAGLPVIMITKSEEENLMNEALGHKISDYLIKPVNPSQILLACKKIFEARELERGTTVRDYVRELGRDLESAVEVQTWEGWAQRYQRSARWHLELDEIEEEGLRQAHREQMDDLNRQFGRFIESNYRGWVDRTPGNRPLLSPDLVPHAVVPHLKEGRKVALIVIDCLRLDQWLAMEPLLPPELQIDRQLFCSVLPTATAYARNAIFSGLYPREIARNHPEFWDEALHSDVGKNRFEREFLQMMLAREGVQSGQILYRKILGQKDADDLRRQMGSYAGLDLVALVFTFFDTFAHGHSRDTTIAELTQDVTGLRAHLRTWFERSVMLEAIREMARQKRVTVITTDHGAVQVRRPALVRADRGTSSGVRFKFGKALRCNEAEALHVRDPGNFGLPEEGLIKNYIFAKEDYFFIYRSHRHEHERILRGSFQHGGISMEEMIVPLVTLSPG